MKRALGSLGAAVFLAFGAQAAQASNLGGYWHFDEGEGVTAADSSGNGNTGTVIGANWVSGRFAGALGFDGLGAKVLVADNPSLEPASVTVETWVNQLGSPGLFRHILAKGA